MASIRSDADDDDHDDGDGDGKSFCVEDDCWPASCSNLFRLMCRATSHHCPLLASHLPCFCSICCLLTTTNVANLSLTMAPKVAFTGSLLGLKVVGEPDFLLLNYSNKLVSFLSVVLLTVSMSQTHRMFS